MKFFAAFSAIIAFAADDTKFVLGEIKKSTPFWQLLEQ